MLSPRETRSAISSYWEIELSIRCICITLHVVKLNDIANIKNTRLIIINSNFIKILKAFLTHQLLSEEQYYSGAYPFYSQLIISLTL
ncbi:hypothetical protein Noc_0285 [Nitrosococcus oceani ATCC 19707]|uniref:Uncharacterized protein n=1 Tax=Nitrosococcus oceani (strain ATCC 19707 / BCRC 17464 / JCM 30415 / NCIMB 11848 / C-107) TaxID=323261 RepID=Q3JED1_NITOC|nr:hypothetical protein Noc_0285 [Nitrosococcus oceani ATCC 19707]